MLINVMLMTTLTTIDSSDGLHEVSLSVVSVLVDFPNKHSHDTLFVFCYALAIILHLFTQGRHHLIAIDQCHL